MHMKSMSPETKRLYFLDSLRGLAALTVVLGHLAATYYSDYFIVHLFGPLGRSAVILFFILSGIVLSLSLRKGENNFQSLYCFRNKTVL
ncbi:acyltransferase family protein [Listeria grandensis]|uniref:Acyltransferase family protein n=1 Tax=Listeria grandensis TaxID=1494963 RepID=A0A7X0Y562_9LIST|nr:acyltransferase family protein [Listeria grandensis]MBC1475042.1 acyltransferase family protein [Listeria grandensis]MBC1937048.1 acyltransferase family protein [Listeria grandensis]